MSARGLGVHISCKHKSLLTPDLQHHLQLNFYGFEIPAPVAVTTRDFLISLRVKGPMSIWPSKLIKVSSEGTENITLHELREAVGKVDIFKDFDSSQIFERMRGRAAALSLVSSDENLLDAMTRASQESSAHNLLNQSSEHVRTNPEQSAIQKISELSAI